ncbi:hypothetical protein D918_01711 [Trichuris suis]|nr:hypothetical protein D918_01711 [Trichuris suis]
MASLDERKVRCLTKWLNLETACAFPPVDCFEQLTDLDQICWLIRYLCEVSSVCTLTKWLGPNSTDFGILKIHFSEQTVDAMRSCGMSYQFGLVLETS